MSQIAQGVAVAFGTTAEVAYTHEFSSTVNSTAETDHALEAARVTLGSSNVDPTSAPMMGAEDFGSFLKHRPGCFAYLGNGTDGPNGQPLHNAHYDFNDGAIGPSGAYGTALVQARLPA